MKDMKHFEIGVMVYNSRFTLKCTTMYEAYGAIIDAVIEFGLEVDLDKVMKTLMNMKEGKTSGVDLCSKLFICLRDGEV